ncbi:hypothetical protein F7I02_19080 [Salmonella enterica]|nr:hypothetical protein [Salmonella enterica]
MNWVTDAGVWNSPPATKDCSPLLAGDKPRRCLAVDKHCAEIHSAGIPRREAAEVKAKKGKTNYDIA